MKKSILAVSVAALFFTACSNSEDFETPQTQKEIALNPVAQKATRTPITGTTFDDGQKIYVSAWNSVSKDYFENVEFGKSDATWKAGKLWPINGVTSFLAYAFTPATQSTSVMSESTAVWGNETSTSSGTYVNWAKQVSFDLSSKSLCYNPVAADGSATEVASETNGTPYVDLLYANADQTKEKDYTTVNMEFKHSGAWILFNVKLANDLSTQKSKLTVNNFELVNIHKGGKLTIDNKIVGGAQASWDFSGCAAADYQVESFPQAASDLTKGLALSTTDQTFGVILPEQQQTAIRFKYTLSSTDTPAAFTSQTVTYTHNLDRFDKWEMGKKYVYTITISFSEIEIKPSVKNWDETSEDINI